VAGRELLQTATHWGVCRSGKFINGDLEMQNIIEMKRARKVALDDAESFVKAAEERKSDFTASERIGYEAAMRKANELETLIKARDGAGSLGAQITAFWKRGSSIPLGVVDETQAAFASPLILAETRKPEYSAALHAFLKTGGKAHSEELLIGGGRTGRLLRARLRVVHTSAARQRLFRKDERGHV
jgi:hypothetical protein